MPGDKISSNAIQRCTGNSRRYQFAKIAHCTKYNANIRFIDRARIHNIGDPYVSAASDNAAKLVLSAYYYYYYY